MLFDISKVLEFDIGHTPGYYYAFAYFVSAVIFLITAKMLRINLKNILISVGFYLMITGIMIMTSGAEGWAFAVTMTVIFGLLFLYILLVSEMSWLKALYFTARSFMVAEFAAAFEWQLFNYFVEKKIVPFNHLTSILFVLAVYVFVFGLTYYIENRSRDYNHDFQPNGRSVIMTLVIGVFTFILSNLSFSALDTPFSGTTTTEVFAIRTLADISGVYILMAVHIQGREVSVRTEREKLDALLKMQEESYRISAESIEVVNRKYHDLKHQLMLLKSDIPQEEKNLFLEEMEQEIAAYEARNKTGNKTLDILLSSKTLQCQKNGITMTCVADGKELNFMRAADISVLFGNAIDNAIESVLKISDREKRLIHLTVAAQKAFVHIRIENTCGDHLEFKDGLPATTKQDAAFHGFGMKSIRSIAEKYHGTMTAALNDGWFELRVLIPIPKE
jgi:hypothetical protein